MAGVLDEPYIQLNKPQLSCRTGPPVYIGWNRVQSILCSLAEWRAGMATPLSWLT
jgi:hypothetical protein